MFCCEIDRTETRESPTPNVFSEERFHLFLSKKLKSDKKSKSDNFQLLKSFVDEKYPDESIPAEFLSSEIKWNQIYISTSSLVFIFRVSCATNFPFWNTPDELTKLISAERDLLASCKPTISELNSNSKSNSIVPLFKKFGLNEGLALQLALNSSPLNPELIRELLDSYNFEDLRITSVIEIFNNDNESGKIAHKVSTPMRDLIKLLPESATKALNKCLNMTKSEDPQLQVSYNLIHDWDMIFDSTAVQLILAKPRDDKKTEEKSKFQMQSNSSGEVEGPAYLPAPKMEIWQDCKQSKKLINPAIPPYCDTREILRLSHPLSLVGSEESGELMTHPVVQLFVRHNWKQMRKDIHISLYFFIPFLIFWEAAVVVATVRRIPSNSTDLVNNKSLNFPRQISQSEIPAWATFWFVGSGCFAVGGIILVGIRLFYYLAYVRSTVLVMANLLEFATYVCVVYYVYNELHPVPDTTVLSGVFGLITAWVTLVFHCKTLPFVGLQIQLFGKIFLNYLKYLSIGIWLVFMFGSCFILLFHNVKRFGSIHAATLATVQVVLSQFTSNEIFTEIFGDNYGLIDISNVGYFLFVFFLLLFFVLLSFLVYMNLLTGLATADTATLAKNAEMDQFRTQMELILDNIYENRQKFEKIQKYGDNRVFDNLCKACFLIYEFIWWLINKVLKKSEHAKLNEIISQGKKSWLEEINSVSPENKNDALSVKASASSQRMYVC